MGHSSQQGLVRLEELFAGSHVCAALHTGVVHYGKGPIELYWNLKRHAPEQVYGNACVKGPLLYSIVHWPRA